MTILKNTDGKPDMRKHGRKSEKTRKESSIRFQSFSRFSLFVKYFHSGLIQGSINDIIQKAKRKRQEAKKGSSRLGMMRHLYIILDCSEAMSIPDLKPNRFLNTLKMLQFFIEEFFDQNPISQVGIILLKNKRAEKISDLAGNYKNHVKMLQG